MSRFNLPTNFIENLESLIRKSKKSKTEEASTSQSNQSAGSPTPISKAMANKTLHQFSAPSTADIRTGPTVNTRDNSFELKLAESPSLVLEIE
jgi:hypothetical protein